MADNVVAKLVPKSAHDGIDEALHWVIDLAEPTFNDAVKDVCQIF